MSSQKYLIPSSRGELLQGASETTKPQKNIGRNRKPHFIFHKNRKLLSNFGITTSRIPVEIPKNAAKDVQKPRAAFGMIALPSML